MADLGTAARPLRVAIVGSGPSGFYAAGALFKSEPDVVVDVFDRLPTPYGLVRGGVAPDHVKIKKVTRAYDRIAANAGFSFLGNVTVGRDIQIEELEWHYDAIILCYGANADYRLGIPGEDLAGSHTATEFVGWYNGHPDYADATFDLSCEAAVIIGHGNVAVDVARILAKTPDELRHTDIAEHALDALAGSKVRTIHIVGRRGPAQAKFTSVELKELGRLSECDAVVAAADLDLDATSRAELEQEHSTHIHHNLAVFETFAAPRSDTKPRQCSIGFLRSPVRIEGDERVERVVLERNRLEGPPFKQRAVGTGLTETLDCGILFRSIGYRGAPIAGAPFDEGRGAIPNEDGRVLADGRPVPGLYAAGWIKRGATGIIGTNKRDSNATVKALVADIPALCPCAEPDGRAVRHLLASRGVRVVSFEDWQRIDAAEIARGEAKGKPREKFIRVEDMLATLSS